MIHVINNAHIFFKSQIEFPKTMLIREVHVPTCKNLLIAIYTQIFQMFMVHKLYKNTENLLHLVYTYVE